MNRQGVFVSVLAGVLVVALWWMFLYSPGQDELSQLEDDIAAAEAEGVSLEQRVARLEAVRARAPETEAAIAQLRGILPAEPAQAAALRQIEAAADDAGVAVSSLTSSRPVIIDEATGLAASTLTLNIDGSYFQVVDFLRRMEDPHITSRGIVMESLAMAVTDHPALTVTVSGQMFAVLEPPPVPEEEAPAEPAESEDADGDATEEEGEQ